MAGNVDHGCVHSHFTVSSACRTCVCPQAPALSSSVVGPVSGSRGRLTPPAAASPQSRAVPGPHSRRHRRRLRHGRCRRRHLALREGSLQLTQRTAKQSARRLLGASAHSSAVERRSRCRPRCAFNCRGQRETDALPLSPLLASGCVACAQTMRFQAPNLGGSFAVWGGLFSAFDCTLVAVRKKARQEPVKLS
jgi:hypothetical protein